MGATRKALLQGMPNCPGIARLHKLESERSRMEAELANPERLPSVPSADMASVYVEKVAGVVGTLAKRDDNNGALEALREVIEKVAITPTPKPKPVEVKVRGSLPGAMSVAQTDSVEKSRELLNWVKNVAETGFVRSLSSQRVSI